MLSYTTLLVYAATPGPCDILAAAGNECVAAHSTVRALYAQYAGPLYKVSRPNNASANISVLKSGFADVAAHERFCAAGDCVIRNVFDQSPQGNHLGQRISDGVVHKMVNASKHKIAVAGGAVPAFGMWFDAGHGYHVDFTRGVAKGNEPESIFSVMSGTHYNGHCCFDYGNSENTALQPVATGDYACGAMEAIYLGNAHWFGNTGYGDTGPWVGADLESGMYYGGGNATKVNPMNKPLTTDFVSLHLKGRTDGFALKGGDATRGALETMYDGPRPDFRSAPNNCHYHGVNGTYQPMRKQGAIILGTGGDNSNGAVGNFYEGFMATGVTSAATDDAIQANIVAVGYKTVAPLVEAQAVL